jgi:hypothetical protein
MAMVQSLRPLAIVDILKRAPSAFADTAHESRSQSYVTIPTLKLIEKFAAAGMVPVAASQSGTGIKAKHSLSFARADLLARQKADNLGNLMPMVQMINSFDGTSSYVLSAAMYRGLCANGLLVASASLGDIRVRHSGQANTIARDVIEGSFEVINESIKSLDKAQEFSSIQLNDLERNALGTAARMLRWDEEEQTTAIPTVQQIITPKRYDDRKNDLWTSFNVVQEHIIKGGDRVITVDAEKGTRKANTTRELTAIDKLTSTNKALWALADMLAQHKAA